MEKTLRDLVAANGLAAVIFALRDQAGELAVELEDMETGEQDDVATVAAFRQVTEDLDLAATRCPGMLVG